MSQTVVVVSFYSRSGATETRALSLAVGAVQERAMIRLRRLPDADRQPSWADGPDHRETLERMQKEYVRPAEGDLRGADAIVIAPTSCCDPSSMEWRPFLDLLRSLGVAGALAGKVGAVVRNRDAAVVERFEHALQESGLTIVLPASASEADPTPQGATAHGRRVAAMARRSA
jgi:hypothetical protein